jgi:DNA mismatch repair ATPase MutS
MAAERWQQRFGSAIRGWLSTVGEFEALSALACYAWEHPADVLPEFVEQRGCFEATGLAHPLLPASTAVGNDLTLGSKMQLIVVSGPNMAGKSTFLRGVGINAVLAQCGAPVRATWLRLSPLAVGASICELDSLQGGVSRFYTEMKRLKLLSDLAEEPAALLFLLDELLSGTNSRDRFDGTRFIPCESQIAATPRSLRLIITNTVTYRAAQCERSRRASRTGSPASVSSARTEE